MDIPHHDEFCLVYNPKKGAAPWFVNTCTLTFLDLLVLGWLQRYTFMTQVCKIEYELRKTFID